MVELKSSNTAKGSWEQSSTEAETENMNQVRRKELPKNRFAQLTSVNPEAIAYVYAPGTQLDEPVGTNKG